MNKKLLVVAVAGALAAPAAYAQSSVTISGFFKGGFEGLSYGNYVRAAGGRHSQTGVVDDSSQIHFNVREDLGGGLAAIGQIDMRFGIDSGALSASGNDHVGLQSSQWGRIFFGRQDLHYFLRESNLTTRGSLRADSISILSYVSPGGTTTAIANATRTTNVVHYTTPDWNGFSAIVAYSANPSAAEADITSQSRAGRAWNFAPYYAGKNFNVGYSYWSAKNDAAAAGVATGNQRGDRLAGSYTWNGFQVGLAWDRSKITDALSGASLADRTAWSIPLEYGWGNHHIYAHFDKAGNDKATAADDAASMFAIAYAYDLSKRTSAAFTYARINNHAGAAYTFFTSAALGIGNSAPVAGEDPRMWGITLRHAF
ncbi:MAG TPA: porin [Burkholderiales bacterium]|nr:porin [Burkholderiales bacterium]